MEWDFKVSDVITGKVDYGLDGFLSDLKNEVNFNFSDMSSKKKERVWRLFYRLMHFSVVGVEKEEILKIFKMDSDCFESLMSLNRENVEMLQAIHMSMFLRNLEVSVGLIGDSDNLCLLNDQLRRFNAKNNL